MSTCPRCVDSTHVICAPARESEVSALRTRVARLEEALAPFATAEIAWASVPEDSVTITHFSRGKITVGDLRRAARVLEETTTE